MSPTYSFGFAELLLSSRLLESGSRERWTLEIVAAADARRRPFLIAAGLAHALELLEGLALAETDLALLRAEPGPGKVDRVLDELTVQHAGSLRFEGDVDAVPEGTVVFGGEPLLRLRAAAPQAAAVASAVLETMGSQTAIATAIARVCLAAAGKPVYETLSGALSRDGALAAARAAHVGGAVATAQPVAAALYGLPALPIVPLSAILAMGGAFRGLERCALRIDGACRRDLAGAVAGLRQQPRALIVEVSSGSSGGSGSSSDSDTELLALRAQLNQSGWNEVALLVTGDLGGDRVASLASGSTPVDGFVVDELLLAAQGGFARSLACEIVERAGAGRRVAVEREAGGRGARAVWRRRERGRFRGDTVQPDTMAPPAGAFPLLVPVMRAGKRLFAPTGLTELRVLCEAQLSMLDPAVTRFAEAEPYRVTQLVDPKEVASNEAAPIESAEPVEPLVPAPVPVTVAPPRLIDQVDDSADFTLVSNAFASVMEEQLRQSGERRDGVMGEATSDVTSAATIAEATGVVSDASSQPESPLLLAAARLRSLQRREVPAPSSVAVAAPIATMADAWSDSHSDAPSDSSIGTRTAVSTSAPIAAKSDDNPLLAAAARLRSFRKP